MSLETVLAYEAGVRDGLAQARKRDTMLDDMCNLIDERDILLAEKALLVEALESSKDLIEVVRMPNIEYVADAHNAAIKRIRAALAAVKEADEPAKGEK